ncbi:hypothetical protein [Pseudonocardia acidicola]|uniref:FDXHR family putative zinc-binding protein n=1 Tax=Pseudonocardia acidicola TaxID=2724939 RepID=UPI003B8336AD
MPRDDPSNARISCPCGASWFGPIRAHCAAPGCHQTFDDAELFDHHRAGGRCLRPSSLRLVRRGTVWSRRPAAAGASRGARRR